MSLGTAALVRASASGLRRFSGGFVQQPRRQAITPTAWRQTIAMATRQWRQNARAGGIRQARRRTAEGAPSRRCESDRARVESAGFVHGEHRPSRLLHSREPVAARSPAPTTVVGAEGAHRSARRLRIELASQLLPGHRRMAGRTAVLGHTVAGLRCGPRGASRGPHRRQSDAICGRRPVQRPLLEPGRLQGFRASSRVSRDCLNCTGTRVLDRGEVRGLGPSSARAPEATTPGGAPERGSVPLVQNDDRAHIRVVVGELAISTIDATEALEGLRSAG